MTTEKFFKSNTALVTLIAACGVVLISLGVRQTFGLFFNDFQRDLGVSITESGLAIGIQMLMWGLTGPIFGGGGHKAASGFSTNLSIEEIKNKVKNAIKSQV